MRKPRREEPKISWKSVASHQRVGCSRWLRATAAEICPRPPGVGCFRSRVQILSRPDQFHSRASSQCSGAGCIPETPPLRPSWPRTRVGPSSLPGGTGKHPAHPAASIARPVSGGCRASCLSALSETHTAARLGTRSNTRLPGLLRRTPILVLIPASSSLADD